MLSGQAHPALIQQLFSPKEFQIHFLRHSKLPKMLKVKKDQFCIEMSGFMPYALCFMLYALCFMLYALCFMLTNIGMFGTMTVSLSCPLDSLGRNL